MPRLSGPSRARYDGSSSRISKPTLRETGGSSGAEAPSPGTSESPNPEAPMNVRPTTSGPISKNDASAIKRASVPPGADGHEAPRPGLNASDQVELSQAARDLSAARRQESASALSPERLKEITSRIAGGYYDRPEVNDRILERLAAELENDVPGA